MCPSEGRAEQMAKELGWSNMFPLWRVALPAGGTTHQGADTVAQLTGSELAGCTLAPAGSFAGEPAPSKQLPRGELRAFISLVPPAKAGKERLAIWKVLDGDTMTSINVCGAG